MKDGVYTNGDMRLNQVADMVAAETLQKGRSQDPTSKLPTSSAVREEGRRPSGHDVVQRNQILANTYEHSESPVTTVKNFVAEQTGRSGEFVLDNMKRKLRRQSNIGGHLDELDSPKANVRPNSVKAYISSDTGSGNRSKLITALGKLGNFEDYLRRGESDQNYDGGHLLALEFFNNWDRINTAYNIAPEERGENQRRAWRAMEKAEKRQFPLLVNVYVNYPTDQYSVSLRTISDQMLTGGLKTEVDRYWFNSLKRVTVNTRLPSQFVTEYTQVDPRQWNEMETGPADKSLGYSPMTILPTRLPRMVFAPVEDLLLRLLSEEREVGGKPARSRGGKGKTGGALVVKNRSIYGFGLARSAAENLARMAVYYFMWTHGYTVSLAVHAALSYFGSGTGETVVQSTTSMLSGGKLVSSTSWLTSMANSLIRYTGGDRMLSLGLNTVTALTTAAINPKAIPAMIRNRLGL